MTNKKKLLMTLLVVGVTIALVMTVHSAYVKKRMQDFEVQYSNPLLKYESNVSVVYDVVKLFEIHNNDTYVSAKDTVHMSDDLKKRFFPSDEYQGANRSSEKPQVRVYDVMYAPDDTSKYDKYFMYVVKANSATKTVGTSYVVVELNKAGVIVDFASY